MYNHLAYSHDIHHRHSCLNFFYSYYIAQIKYKTNVHTQFYVAIYYRKRYTWFKIVCFCQKCNKIQSDILFNYHWHFVWIKSNTASFSLSFIFMLLFILIDDFCHNVLRFGCSSYIHYMSHCIKHYANNNEYTTICHELTVFWWIWWIVMKL